MRLYEHNVVPAWSFPVALVKTSSIFVLYFVFSFLQLWLGSQSAYNYCRSSTFVCTGQRLVRARVVLWSIPGLASMKHFAVFSSDTYSRKRIFSRENTCRLCIIFFSRIFVQRPLSKSMTQANRKSWLGSSCWGDAKCPRRVVAIFPVWGSKT